MTVHQIHGRVPTWDLADRMRKALRESDLGVADIAREIGVSRNSVSNWINGRVVPARPIVQLWAIHTRIDRDWLETGRGEPHRPASDDEYAARESNPQPADLGDVVRFPPTRPSLPEAVAA